MANYDFICSRYVTEELKNSDDKMLRWFCEETRLDTGYIISLAELYSARASEELDLIEGEKERAEALQRGEDPEDSMYNSDDIDRTKQRIIDIQKEIDEIEIKAVTYWDEIKTE